MAMSAIPNNTVNGEGIFNSGMKKIKKTFTMRFGRLVNVT